MFHALVKTNHYILHASTSPCRMLCRRKLWSPTWPQWRRSRFGLEGLGQTVGLHVLICILWCRGAALYIYLSIYGLLYSVYGCSCKSIPSIGTQSRHDRLQTISFKHWGWMRLPLTLRWVMKPLALVRPKMVQPKLVQRSPCVSFGLFWASSD